VSRYQISEVIEASNLITHVTIVGKLIPATPDDYMKLVRLAHDFKRTVLYATRMIAKGMKTNDILKELRNMLNKAYADAAYKSAKAIVKGCKFNGGTPSHIKVRKLFILSDGEASKSGNRNIRLESTNLVRIRYPHDHSWILLKVYFGKEYLPLIQELTELTKQKRVSYAAKVVFRNGKIYLHLSIPINTYLKYFNKGEAKGGLIAGFDLNSDRINMVIIDRYCRIRDIRTERFPEVTSHGYLRNKAKIKRLKALARLLKYAYYHNVGTVVFENLLTIKQRKYTRNPTTNRKIAKFAKRELLRHGIIMSMKYRFKTLLVNPKGTTHSKEHNKVMRMYGLDKHTASAYLIALKSIGKYTKDIKI